MVLSAPTAEGTVFLKAPADSTAFEVDLYGLLTSITPDRVLPPIAVHPTERWLLLPDGGPVLSDQHEGEALLDRLVTVVPQYAQLQIDLQPHVDALLALGVADMRPARMLERFDEAVSGVEPATSDEHARLALVAAQRARFGAWCDQLAASPPAPSLDHNDLHGANVFLAADDQARFFDWGDAVVVATPRHALVLRSVARWVLGEHHETPPERRLLDAYLEPFTAVASRRELVDALPVACEVGKVARSLVWARAVADLPPDDEDPDDFRAAPLGWLLELLDGPLDRGAGAVMRRATRADVPAIVALLADDELGRQREDLADPLPEAYWEAFAAIDADPRQLLAVAEREGTIVGTLQLTFLPHLTHRGSERALVEAVRIARDARGGGLGRTMLEWAIEQARQRGCRMVQLTTDKQRTDARRFYESLGFEATHEGMKLPL